ncbi:isoprenylcysteine carboxylmethyltransferase family protein [Nioella sp. MMSF_3534]|uniref:methyltransferase family protein n=1 Tax=Nioella sp. MMSF_3534 TaxID=3046720 RepID=UPI00273D47B5|nr:isoprenylcysteine carboxylmethyltransferase family protein [Nioella sp. MMSF_3534]
MLINDHLANMGETLFRWRSFVLTLFIPIVFFAIWQGEAIELRFGDTVGEIYEAICLVLVLTGVGLRAFTVGYVPARTSGRNTKGQVADSLNTTGIYSVVRNPLYLANAIGYMGVALYTQWLWVGALMALVLVIYFERIIAAEERFLSDKFGQDYSDWAARTPAFFPRLSGWVNPALPFSWRTVFRREHPSWLSTMTMMYALEMLSTWRKGEALSDATAWHVAMLAVIALQIVMMALKKWTRFFRVDGR